MLNIRKTILGITVITVFLTGFITQLHIQNEGKLDDKKSCGKESKTLLRATGALAAMKWYNDQRAYPEGRIPTDWREKAINHIEKNNISKVAGTNDITWTPVGPTNIGGRVRSIAIDPNNPLIIYAGSVSGGIWKSTNGGNSWLPKTDFAQNLVIGSIAIDPANTNIIYAGTGEGYFNVDALRGIGVLKSTDGGENWILLNNFVNPGPNYYYYYINKILINPSNPQILFAAVTNNSEGIWRSTNGGTSWNRLTSPGQISKFCMDLVMDPINPNIMYASFGLFSADGIYKTTDGGSTWNLLSNGFPARSTKFLRISLAIARSNPQILYACLSDSNYYTHSIQKSTNGGANWFQVGTPYDNKILATHLGGQGWYNNIIAVHPDNPDIVFTGGINLFKSVDGGLNWTRISDGYTNKGNPLYVHVDQHVMVFHTNNSSIIYIGNDGGLFKSEDAGSTFNEINTNFQTVQFYSGAVHPTQEIYFGGTQDNGTLRTTAQPGWSMVLGGDGGATWVDPQNTQTVYTEYVYMCLQKSTNGGNTWTRIMTGIPTAGSSQYDGTSDRCSFIAPFEMSRKNPQILVAGSYRVFRTTNGGISWSAISSDLTGDGTGGSGAVISALAIAPSSTNTIYAGTSGSGTSTAKVLVTTNGGTGWIDVTKTPLPNRYVRAIAVSHTDSARAYVGFSGYGTGHLYLTTNRGNTWTNISGDLPDIPVNAILVDSISVSHLLVGTDLGVFETIDGGTNWIHQNNGMANVSIADLDINRSAYIYAATHGRGMFKSDIPLGVKQNGDQLPKDFTLYQNYPNPFNPVTTIEFYLAKRAHVELTVYDIIGRMVRLLEDNELPGGSYQKNFIADDLSSGIYFYRLIVKDAVGIVYSDIKKMILLK